eukprot:6181956-Pyramimonas_sp.AAC.1
MAQPELLMRGSEVLLDTAPFEVSVVERLGTESAVRYALHGQREDVSDVQAEGKSFHAIENNEGYARFHSSPGPSRHLGPLLDVCDGPTSDPIMDEASQEGMMDSHDEGKDEE